MSNNIFLRMTIDVCVFTSESDNDTSLARFARRLKQTGKFVDEPLGRELMEFIKDGVVEIDGVSEVEDHT